MRRIKYTYLPIQNCNMCGTDKSQFRILGKRLNQRQGIRPTKKFGITTTIVRCENCGLIFSNPQPIPENLESHYAVAPEEYWKKEYFVLDENYFASAINKLKTLLDYKTGLKSLDIGAGIGKCMIALSKAGFDSYGIEPSQMYYDRAIERMGINSDKLRLSSIDQAEFVESSFDFITFGVVLEHLYNPSEALKKAIKWLKPNGIIRIEAPSSNWLISKLVNSYYKIIGTDYVTNISPMHAPYHLYEFSLKSFEKNSKINGYEIVDYEYFVCSTYMPKFIDFFIRPYMKFTKTGMEICVWLRKKIKSIKY